jgi:hypothetical protein
MLTHQYPEQRGNVWNMQTFGEAGSTKQRSEMLSDYKRSCCPRAPKDIFKGHLVHLSNTAAYLSSELRYQTPSDYLHLSLGS